MTNLYTSIQVNYLRFWFSMSIMYTIYEQWLLTYYLFDGSFSASCCMHWRNRFASLWTTSLLMHNRDANILICTILLAFKMQRKVESLPRDFSNLHVVWHTASSKSAGDLVYRIHIWFVEFLFHHNFKFWIKKKEKTVFCPWGSNDRTRNPFDCCYCCCWIPLKLKRALNSVKLISFLRLTS